MIEILLEVTEWNNKDFTVKNHKYAVDKVTGKLIGFWANGVEELKVFAKPMMFTKTGRKFKKLKVVESL